MVWFSELQTISFVSHPLLNCALQFKLSTHSLQTLWISSLAEFPFSSNIFFPQKLVNDYMQLCGPFLYFCCISGKDAFLALFEPEGMIALQWICGHILLCSHSEYLSCHNQSSSPVQHLCHEAKGAKRCHMMTSGCLDSPSPMLLASENNVRACVRVCAYHTPGVCLTHSGSVLLNNIK